MGQVETATPIILPQPALDDPPPPARDLAITMFRRMLLIRSFELRVNELFMRGLIPGTIHLSHGQEATTVGTSQALRPDDLVTLTHRGHGQALAKGLPPAALLAELLGRQAGCVGGKGGSLHIGDLARGILPAIAIVGAAAPIATGFGFAYARSGSDRVVCTYFGDGTVNKGDWHEAMNLAALWSLPVVFLCENNLYASTTPLSEVLLNERLSERAAAYRMPAELVDGNRVMAVYQAVARAVARARRGDGPTFVECLTYRRGGHKREDPGVYRPKDEVAAWLDHDPIPLFRERLLGDRVVTEAALDRLEAAVADELDQATELAMASPPPDPEKAVSDVYT